MRWWYPLAGLAVLLVLVPVASVVEFPGERDVKEFFGVAPAPECGRIVRKGDPREWRRERPMRVLGDGPAGAVVGQAAYLVGGIADFEDDGTTAVSVNAVERYDFRRRRWHIAPPLPQRLNHATAVAWGGQLYVVGGLLDDLTKPTGKAWKLNIEEGRWERLPPLPTPRGAAAAAVVGHRLYVAGGLAGVRRSAELEAFDLREERWIRLPSMHVPRDHAEGAELDGRLYVLGGRQRDLRGMTAFERYDPRARRWERLPDLPNGTAGFGLAEVGGRLVAAGGEDLSRHVLNGHVWSFDPREGRWRSLPGMSRPKHDFAMLEHRGRLWAFGGSRCSGFFPVRSVESWEPPAA